MSQPKANLEELLLEWEERRERGEIITPEALCSAVPNLLHELARRIRLLEDCDRLLCPKPAIAAGGPATSPGLPLPEMVAGYQVRGLLGTGGMSVVYKAYDPVLRREVAVKTLRPASPHADREDHRQLVERFRREGQVLARLRHEAIVTVFEAGIQDGVPCIVMEYEPGGSLADHRERFTHDGPSAIIALMERAARAVAHVHRQGILHRDLKPANFLFDAGGQLLVSDFGLAKVFASKGDVCPPAQSAPADAETALNAAETQLTFAGVQPGTWAYMAPEQYDPARFGPVGPATDIWALGVILYELLTGRRPFAGRSWGELREQVCAGQWPEAPEINRRIRQVVGRCLAKEPIHRFQNADQFADSLRATAPHRRWIWAAFFAAALVVPAAYPYFPTRIQIAAAWPNLPAVLDAQHRLARGEQVQLIGPGQPPGVFDWATGPETGRVLSDEGEGLRIMSVSPVGCLVELLPALPPGRYEVEAEMRHESGIGLSWVGLYAGGSHCQIPRGRQHFVLMARYSDRGPTAEEKTENNTALSNRRTHLLATYFGDSDRDLFASVAQWAPPPGGRLLSAPPPGWRRVSLTIDANGVTAAQEDTPVGSFGLWEAEQTLANARREHPDLSPEWPVQLHGGVGIYVFNGSLSVRSFRITPLSPTVK